MKLMVLDGNSIVNRAFYGIRPLTTKDGLYTNAVYGFVTTLQRLLEEEQPERNIHVFNSCSASSGEVLAALKIQELASSGMPFKKVVREVEQFIYQMQTLFVLESLDNLRKNGRLTKSSCCAGPPRRVRSASWDRPCP